MKLTRNDLMLLAAALKSLDGRRVVETDGDGKAHAITKPFDLSGKVRYACARMQRALKAPLEEVEDMQRALWAEHAQGADELKGAAARAYDEARSKALREEIDFTEHKIQACDLKIETNQLDPSIVAALLPILDGEI